MTHIEMILEMAKMQEKLDEALLEKGRALGKIKDFDRERTTFALIDELGELVHELKGQWCWWKATQAPVNTEKLLEELVDCWHFALSLDNHNVEHSLRLDLTLIKPITTDVLYNLFRTIRFAINDMLVTEQLYKLTYDLGFTMEDVYKGYIEKNKKNYERIANGY